MKNKIITTFLILANIMGFTPKALSEEKPSVEYLGAIISLTTCIPQTISQEEVRYVVEYANRLYPETKIMDSPIQKRWLKGLKYGFYACSTPSERAKIKFDIYEHFRSIYELEKITQEVEMLEQMNDCRRNVGLQSKLCDLLDSMYELKFGR